MKKTIPDIGGQLHAQIAETLPEALEKAINSYHDFMDCPDGDKSTEFKNHHTAAKAALAHIELLIKLAALVEINDSENVAQLSQLIKNARNELDGK